MNGKACLFVDGENLRHGLIELLKDTEYSGYNYLPDANWADLFDWIAEKSTNNECNRLRAYWYVIEKIDYFPYNLGYLGRPENKHILTPILQREKAFRRQIKDLDGTALETALKRIMNELRTRKRIFQSRFEGQTNVQDSIALKNRAITFRRSGAIRYSLLNKKLGEEKTVDVALACDLVTLSDIFDVAIIVSGDQDYVPAAQKIQDLGKTVINVAFEKRNGDLLPGGARRLNIRCDSSFSVPHADLLKFIKKKKEQ